LCSTLALLSASPEDRTVRSPLLTDRQNYIKLTILGPFLATIGAALAITLYMVLGPAQPIKKLMELTKTRWDFQLFMILVGVLYLIVAWLSEKFLLPWLARHLGRARRAVTKRPKKRKEYKEILDGMRM
jgi:cation-transporting P-type ATPase 13A2